MGTHHSHANHLHEKSIGIALLLTASFFLLEFIGGLLTNSLVLLSDAAHMFTDTAALAIAMIAIRLAKRPADNFRTFGYLRFEILAAILNGILLLIAAFYILFEAYQRFYHPPEVKTIGMLLIAIIGLMINIISVQLLRPGKDDNLNIKSAYLEVWNDMLGSVGVIVAALIMMWTGWKWIDTFIAIAIGVWILPRTWGLLIESVNVLLEGVPKKIKLQDVKTAISAINGVDSFHDLHVWMIANHQINLTVHIVSNFPTQQWPLLLENLRTQLYQQFDIHHITLQIEQTPCQ